MEVLDYFTMEYQPPELEGQSKILEPEHLEAMGHQLPARTIGDKWRCIFSTDTDGFNLRTLYRKMAEYDCPIVLAIKDRNDAVFGAYLPCPLRPSDGFYGTGESFLFTCYPAFKVFKWTNKNDYFMKGNMDSLSIGVSEGHFGLWLDADLDIGRSVHCQTYDNDPLASSDDFKVKELEAWGVGAPVDL